VASIKKTTKKKTIARSSSKKAFSKKPVAKKRAPAPKKTVAKLAPTKSAKPKRAPGLPERLRDAALKVLDDRQAEDIVTIDLTGKSSMADYLIVASGRASRQISSMAHYLREAFAPLGVHQLRVEGAAEGNWVLVDAGDIIIHLFRPEVRRYYDLESIWQTSRRGA
jgi:ribosome-associated protein